MTNEQLKDWRNLQDDITTDSLWISKTSTKNYPLFIIPKRDWELKNDPDFQGLFIPEIPYQFIRRFFTRKWYYMGLFFRIRNNTQSSRLFRY